MRFFFRPELWVDNWRLLTDRKYVQDKQWRRRVKYMHDQPLWHLVNGGFGIYWSHGLGFWDWDTNFVRRNQYAINKKTST